MAEDKSKNNIDLELILKIIENRGYCRASNIPSMNTLILEKVKSFYVSHKKRR